MTFNELHEEYMKMCDGQEDCSECKYDGNFPCQLSFGYSKGRADQKEEDNAFFNFEGAWELEKKKVREDVVEEIKQSIIPTMYEFDATQDTIDFCINILEQFKEQK